MNPITVQGSSTDKKSRPASLDIPARARLCLEHMLTNCDRKYNYVPWVGVTLGEDPPHFVHHRLDWTEVLPYSIYGMVIARDLTGSEAGADVQLAQRKLYLGFFNEQDGLIHAPKSPWNERYPLCLWEQVRALYAFIYWFQDDPDERLVDAVKGIVDGLFALSRQEGRLRVFPPDMLRAVGMGIYGIGTLIDPLTKVYELFGDTRALQMAEGLVHFMLAPGQLAPGQSFFDEQGRFSTFFRTVAAVINGLSRFAALSDRPDFKEKAKLIHDHALSLTTRYGATPCTEPACSNMELNWSARSLIQAGYDEYWDQIDRFARNQTAEAQFLDPSEWVREKAVRGRILDKEKWVYEYWPPELKVLPYDDYENVVNRSVGGFMWSSATEHLFIPASLMLCCSAHALRTFHLVWKNAVTEDLRGLAVNLHVSCENDLAEVISYEPFAGRTVVIPKKNASLRIRIPDHALGGKVQARAGGRPLDVPVRGRYAELGPAAANTEYSLEFDLNERTTEEKEHVFVDKDCARPAAVRSWQVRWRGNTVIEVQPASREEKRLYKRQHLDTARVENRETAYFLPGKSIGW